MAESVQSTLFFLILATVMFLPGLYIVLSRVTVWQPLDKSIVYLCAELSLTPEKWPDKKKEIEAEESKNIIVPIATTLKGLLNPLFIGARTVSAIWYALIFLLVAILVPNFGKTTPPESFKDLFVVIFYLIIIGTVFLYYFRSVAADLYTMEERSGVTAGFLLDMNWSAVSNEMLELVQEQIKTDHDFFKETTGLGGVLLIIFSAISLMWTRLGTSLPNNISIPLLGILASIIFFKWAHESNRSRIVHIALNALIMVRKESFSREKITDSDVQSQHEYSS